MTRAEPGASSSKPCSARMLRGWPDTSARSAVTRPSSERAPPSAARARPVRVSAPGRGDRRDRALGGRARSGRACRGRVLPARGGRGSVLRAGPAAGPRSGARQRARSECGRDLERAADAAGGVRPARGRSRADRRRAGRLALARRGRAPRPDRSGRRLDRATSIVKLTIQPAVPETFVELETWRYEAPYDFYDGDQE